MTERDEPPYPTGSVPVHGATDSRPDIEDWREQTTPGLTPVRGGPVPGVQPYDGAAYAAPGYGVPGYGAPGYGGPAFGAPSYGTPGYGPAFGGPSYGVPGPGTPAYGPATQAVPGYGTGFDAAGFDAGEYGTGEYGPFRPQPAATAPEYSSRPVAVRRADALAALLLLATGIAAGVSLLLHWLSDTDQTGWVLLRNALRDIHGIFHTGLWQPLAIILGGGALFVLGLLMLIPARAHRLLGLIALLVTIAVGAGVLVPLADASWRLGPFDMGFFLGFGVAGLGLIGALKALLTGPRFGRR